jgi:hypothetical protein
MSTSEKHVERVVRQGTYRYANERECDVRVVYSPVRHGTGDDADAEEYAVDQVIDSYYVQYGGPLQRGVFISGGGCFPTLEDAVQHIEAAVQGVAWQE